MARTGSVPYGHGELEFAVPEWAEMDVLGSRPAEPVDVGPAVRDALGSPLGGRSLLDLAGDAVARRAGATAIIAVTDLTRACPDDALVPPLLAELNAGGIPDDRITVIVGVGLHRATTAEEKRQKLGAVVDRVRVVDSDGRDPAMWADLGSIPPYGVPGSTQRIATYLRFAPTPVVREGGSIIVPAELPEGEGGGAGEQRFLAALQNAESPAAVVESARRHFAGGEQRAVMVALTLQHCQIVVAASRTPEVVRLAKLRAAADVEEALEIAYEHIGRPRTASVLLVPRALHTLPVVTEGALA